MNDAPPAFTFKAMLRRAAVDTWIKALGTAVIMTVFFMGYFAVLHDTSRPAAIVPATWLDGLVGFQPWTLTAYFSLWVYASMPASLMVRRRELFGYGFGTVALGGIGLLIFWFWPTAIQAPAHIDWHQHKSMLFLKTSDTSRNACPSLHAAFAVFSCIWFVRQLRSLGAGRIPRAVNLLWALLIVHSTLGTHQHVALDVLFGAALGALVAAINIMIVPLTEESDGDRRALWTAVAIIKTSAVLLWTSGIPFGWCFLIFVSGGLLVLHHIFIPNAQGIARVFSTFVTPRREVWLTIDDGPNADDTPRILDALDRHDARATFFIVGERAARHPALVAEILRRGHEVAHHTQTHPCGNFWCATPARLRRELTNDSLPGEMTRFRSPVGFKPIGLARALRQRGLDCIGWSIRSGDSFARDPARVAARVLRAARPGSIILMHEGPPVRPAVRVAAIEQVLAGLAARGCRCVIPDRAQLR